MKLWAKILIGVVITGILFLVIGVFSIIGTNNDCVQMEAGLKAQYDSNRNSYDSMWKKFKESTQVTTMYSEDLKKIYDSAIENRYKNSTQVAMQWIKEHNPNFDASMYKNLQAMIESGRNSFEANQKMLLDKKRLYEIQLQTFPNSIITRVLGFPKIDLAKYDIVTSGQTEDAFKTKKADEIKLR
jgi:hypothetical protein